jgi:hypothetical protein
MTDSTSEVNQSNNIDIIWNANSRRRPLLVLTGHAVIPEVAAPFHEVQSTGMFLELKSIRVACIELGCVLYVSKINAQFLVI